MTRRSTRSWCTPAPACSPGPVPAAARRFRGNAARPAAGARRPGGPGPVPCRGRPGDQRVHRADGRLHRGAVLDDPQRRRRGAGPGPAPAPPQLRDPPRRPGTGPRPVPVPRVRVPPDRPAPHPALGQRRPHRPGQPDQPVPLAPQWSTTAATPSPPRPAAPSRSTAPTARRCRPARPCPHPGRHQRPTHDADITPDTIIPPWYGERLDLDHAIWACFANARTREERERGKMATQQTAVA